MPTTLAPLKKPRICVDPSENTRRLLVICSVAVLSALTA